MITPPLSANARGILLMCGSMLAFTVNDSFMKAAALEMPMFQAIALRGFAATLGLMLIARLTTGNLHLMPARADRSKVIWRTLADLAATATFMTALTQMPLANLAAIMQSLPLAITLCAALFLREPVGWRRITAILIGFAGVMLIVRPGTGGFTLWSVLGLCSVGCVVVRDLTTRGLTRATPSVAVAVWASVAVLLMGLTVTTLHGWQPVTPLALARLAVASVALIAGYMLAVMVMRAGEIGVVAPFRYTSLIWAILFGWLMFGTLPDRVTMAGAAIVVTTGLYTLWRERQSRAAT